MALTVIKFDCVLLGLIIFAVLRYRQSENRWLTLRLKAEVCRSTMATWNSPMPVEPLVYRDVPELRDLIQTLRYFRATSRVETFPLEAFKADYGVRRLLNQYRYFSRQVDQAIQLSSRLTPFYWLVSGSALVTCGAAVAFPLVYGLHATPGTWTNFTFILVPIVAPALASWILAWQAIESVGRKRMRFAEMKQHLHQALIDLVHCRSWEAAHQVVVNAEKLLLNEVLEWYSFVRHSK
jgi:hypothetical protein